MINEDPLPAAGLEAPPRSETVNKQLQAKLSEIEDQINEVEGDTKNVTRGDLRDFLEELSAGIRIRLDALGDGDDT